MGQVSSRFVDDRGHQLTFCMTAKVRPDPNKHRGSSSNGTETYA